MAEVLMLVGIGVLIGCLLLTLLALIFYSGLFERVDVGAGKPPIGEALVAYKYCRGPYKGAGQIFNEVTLLAPMHKCIGIYYDDPNLVPAEKLRFIVGSVLAEGDEAPDEALQKTFVDSGYQMMRIPAVTNAVKTVFPHRTTLSIFIAVYRVYPQISRYISEHRLCAHPCLEIYDGENIHFMAPLARQNEFYAEETREDQKESEEQSFEENTDDSLSSDRSRGGSVDQSFMDASLASGEQSQSATEDVSSADQTQQSEPESVPSGELPQETAEEEKVTPPQSAVKEELPEINTSLVDSGVSSEQRLTPEPSPERKRPKKSENGNESEGNDSGSSFEEIHVPDTESHEQ